jgi:hypothetical protein
MSTAQAGAPKTHVREITGWSDTYEDKGQRVIEVTTPQGPVICIEDKLKFGGGFSSNPKGQSVALSCDWSPK